MAKKHGAREPKGLARTPVTSIPVPGELWWSSSSAGLSDPGFHGRQTARGSSSRGLLNKRSFTIGVSFPEPAPGSFWAEDAKYGWKGVVHNDFVPQAREERREERKLRKNRKVAAKKTLRKSAERRVRALGVDPRGFLGDLAVVIAVEMIAQERLKVLGIRAPGSLEHSEHHRVQGVRKPTPEHLRTGVITRTSAGPSVASARSMPKPFTQDGHRAVTPPVSLDKFGQPFVRPGHVQAVTRINQKQ